MPASPPILSRHGDKTHLAITVQPNAKHTAADGIHDNTLRIRLAAPPVDGKANQALIEWLASELRLPRRAVTLVRGDTSRRKTVAIDAPLGQVATWLRARTSPKPSPPTH